VTKSEGKGQGREKEEQGTETAHLEGDEKRNGFWIHTQSGSGSPIQDGAITQDGRAALT